MTDGKSIISGPVLIEHTAGEQKHLEMSSFPKALAVEDAPTHTHTPANRQVQTQHM